MLEAGFLILTRWRGLVAGSRSWMPRPATADRSRDCAAAGHQSRLCAGLRRVRRRAAVHRHHRVADGLLWCRRVVRRVGGRAGVATLPISSPPTSPKSPGQQGETSAWLAGRPARQVPPPPARRNRLRVDACLELWQDRALIGRAVCKPIDKPGQNLAVYLGTAGLYIRGARAGRGGSLARKMPLWSMLNNYPLCGIRRPSSLTWLSGLGCRAGR